MRLMLAAAMALLLFRSEMAMGAVRDSCRLFVTAVMPGLLPYMVLSSMLVSRCRSLSPGLLVLLGWCGGSPTGARLAALSGLTGREHRFVCVAAATMSPMFLLGTCGGWLGSARAGWVLLISVLAGGAAAGAMAAGGMRGASGGGEAPAAQAPLTLGAAVEQTARTLLTVCGTMAVWRVLAAFAAEWLPGMALPLSALLEVTCGVRQLSQQPLPLAWRTALIAGVTGAGGMAILTQNRAAAGAQAMPLGRQILWQAVHGGLSFLLALGLMTLLGES
ncbi:MAG: hypothetical protein IJE07_02140 [Clostridia bacterium]|nr:hypothetical protein [Clostridia bacterium]